MALDMMPPEMRTKEEAIIDRLLLLYLINHIRSKGYGIQGTKFQKQLKINKLLYFVESRLFERKEKALNYFFVKWDWGPFSRETYPDVDHLATNHLLGGDYTMEMTDNSKILIRQIEDIIWNSTSVLKEIDRVVNEFGAYNWDEIKGVAYAYPTPGTKIPLSRVKKGTPILRKLYSSEALSQVTINEEWTDTLSILFDPYLYDSITRSIDLLREDKGEDWEKLVKSLKHG